MIPFYKTMIRSGLLLTALAGFKPTAQAQFTNGNIVVLQVGDGTATLVNTGNAVFLKEYNRTTANQTTAVSTVTVPTTGASRFVIAGSATSEGNLALSSDSLKLVFAGYDTTTTNATSASGATSANIRRVIDTVGFSGVAGRADSTAAAFSANNIRGAVKGAGEDYWGIGGNTGIFYFGNTAAQGALGTSATNIRVIQVINGNLYYTSGTAAYLGLNKVAGLPTTGTSAGTLLFNSGTGSSPYGLAINASETIAYLADDRTAALGGGVQKWVNTNGTWAIADTINMGGGVRGLAVDWSGTYPKIYATTSAAATGNTLVMATDSNFAAGFTNSFITLATAPANTAFRGVAFTPKGCTPPALSVTSTNISCGSGGSATVTATGTGPFTYSWTGPSNFTAFTSTISNLTTAGTYTVTVTASGGCTTSASATITSSATITATATAAGSTTFCQGDSVRLRSNTAAGYSYQWLRDTTQISGAVDSFYVARVSGSYKVRITSGSCVATSTAITVTVNPLPVATVTISRDTTFCQGDSTVLSTVTSTGYFYQWFRNGVAISGATRNTYTAIQTGNYAVRVTDPNLCPATSRTIAVNAKPVPVPAITYTSGTLSVANAGGYTNLQWLLSGATVAGATGSSYTPGANGTYTLQADSNGCTGMSNAITVANAAVTNPSGTAFQMYPNPATSQVSIRPSGNYQVRLTDIQGRQVLQTTTTSQFDISGLAKGIYRLQITNAAGNTTVLKLVKTER